MRGDFLGDNLTVEDAAGRAAEHYRRAGWSPSTSVGSVGMALWYGPRPAEEAIARCHELLRDHEGDRASEASILVSLARLEAVRGQFAEARATVARARATWEELGQTYAVEVSCGAASGVIEVIAGDLEAAEALFRATCEACVRFNASAYLASVSAKLADVLYDLGRYDDAEEWTATSQNLAGPEDRDAQCRWRAVAAKLQARRGEVEAAERLAREAIDIADSTDVLNQRAKLRLDLAEVLRIAGRDADATGAVEEAIALYERKGNVVAAQRARTLLDVSALAET
jgi:tetratricopeptide (TPR) repeat protein